MIYTDENWKPSVTYCEPNKSEETMKPTEKQLKFIEDIQEFTGKVFNGNTKKEASKFISENIEQYKLEMEVRSPKWGYE